MKRVVSMQDLSCMGKCSLTIALPVLSAMGVECAPLPTAVLSTHTAFPHPAVVDLSDELEAILAHWAALAPEVDGISIGYLASPAQCRQAEKLIDTFYGAFLCVDPAMADHGKLYAGLPSEQPQAMGRLCAGADLILPNITEAAMLTGMAYRPDPDEPYCRELVHSLLELGCGGVILTGFRPQAGRIGFLGKMRQGDFFQYHLPEIPRACHGTGDLFAAGVMGGIMRGLTPFEAGALACDTVSRAIRRTPADSRWGVAFEQGIPELIQKLHEKASLG